MDKPKIFVFCNNCSPQWHSFEALSEDGCFLAGHICSHHGFANHDMGIDPDGWKRDTYDAHYPDGYEVVLVDARDPLVGAAHAKHKLYSKEGYSERMSVHRKE